MSRIPQSLGGRFTSEHNSVLLLSALLAGSGNLILSALAIKCSVNAIILPYFLKSLQTFLTPLSSCAIRPANQGIILIVFALQRVLINFSATFSPLCNAL